MRKGILLLSALFISFSSHAKKTTTPSIDLTVLNQTTAKYRSAKLVQMTVEKTVKSDLAAKQSQYKGVIYLSSGLFRLENTAPEKSLLVFDGKTIWNEQPPSPDFPGPVQVTKTKLVGKGKSQALFATLLTKDPVTKHFKVTSEKVEGGTTIYQAEALSSDLNVKNLTLKIETKSKKVSEISYKDDLDNMTVMKFSDPQFKHSLDGKLFK